MTNTGLKTGAHPAEAELAGFLAGKITKVDRERMEEHLGSCDQCLDRIAAAHGAVTEFNRTVPRKKIKDIVMKKANIYLLLTIISFCLSFIISRHFLQLLVATLLFGVKWVADTRSTKMLISIREAYKRDRISLK